MIVCQPLPTYWTFRPRFVWIGPAHPDPNQAVDPPQPCGFCRFVRVTSSKYLGV